MALHDLYSKWKKRTAKAGKPDVYRYDQIPQSLRVQIVGIWKESIGPCQPFHRPYDPHPDTTELWEWIHESLAREKGVYELAKGGSHFERCVKYLHSAENLDDVLDVIQFTFQVISRLGEGDSHQVEYDTLNRGAKQMPAAAINELNARLKEAGIGYQFERGHIIEISSQYVHAEVVRPALQLLAEEGFDGAEDEFQRAHKHYRAKEYAEAISNGLKALESTLKAICDKQKWSYPKKATADDLIKIVFDKIVFDNGLLPPYLKSHFDAFQRAMEKGLPPLRNELGGHGQGSKVRDVPEYLAGYAIHTAAANIVLLVRAHKDYLASS